MPIIKKIDNIGSLVYDLVSNIWCVCVGGGVRLFVASLFVCYRFLWVFS